MPKIFLYATLKLDPVPNSLFHCIALKIIFKTLTAPWFWARVPTYKPSLVSKQGYRSNFFFFGIIKVFID